MLSMSTENKLQTLLQVTVLNHHIISNNQEAEMEKQAVSGPNRCGQSSSSIPTSNPLQSSSPPTTSAASSISAFQEEEHVQGFDSTRLQCRHHSRQELCSVFSDFGFRRWISQWQSIGGRVQRRKWKRHLVVGLFVYWLRRW
ncbi:unnamed protein product [Linum trigynum]|uniref:Uncharacterized protein n=1 Tax=Linum trigynum TaxID=586398 RepID=A0AAV2FNT8_9ROSI